MHDTAILKALSIEVSVSFVCLVLKDASTLMGHKCQTVSRVHTDKIVQNSRTFQGLLKDFPTVFKD